MSFTLQQAILGLEGIFKYSEHRMKMIKDKLKAHQPITDEDDSFFDNYPASLISDIQLVEKLKASPSFEKTESELTLEEKRALAKLLYEGKAYLNNGVGSSRDGGKRIRQENTPCDNTNKRRRTSELRSVLEDNAVYSNHQQQHSTHAYANPVGMGTNGLAHNLSELRTPLNFELSINNTPVAGPSQEAALDHHQRQDSDRNSTSTTSTPSTTPNATSSKKREVATLAQKIEILTWYQLHGENQTQTAKHFDRIYPELKLSQPLISSWLKNTQSLQNQYNNTAPATAAAPPTHRRRQQKTKHVQVTEALEKWCQQAVLANKDLNGDVIREKWREYATFFQVPQSNWLKLSEGWLSSFKERNGLKGFKRHANGANARANLMGGASARANAQQTAVRNQNGTTHHHQQQHQQQQQQQQHQHQHQQQQQHHLHHHHHPQQQPPHPQHQPIHASMTPPTRTLIPNLPPAQEGPPLINSMRPNPTIMDNNSSRGSPMIGNTPARLPGSMLAPPTHRLPTMMESHNVLDTFVHMSHMHPNQI